MTVPVPLVCVVGLQDLLRTGNSATETSHHQQTTSLSRPSKPLLNSRYASAEDIAHRCVASLPLLGATRKTTRSVCVRPPSLYQLDIKSIPARRYHLSTARPRRHRCSHGAAATAVLYAQRHCPAPRETWHFPSNCSVSVPPKVRLQYPLTQLHAQATPRERELQSAAELQICCMYGTTLAAACPVG